MSKIRRNLQFRGSINRAGIQGVQTYTKGVVVLQNFSLLLHSWWVLRMRDQVQCDLPSPHVAIYTAAGIFVVRDCATPVVPYPDRFNPVIYRFLLLPINYLDLSNWRGWVGSAPHSADHSRHLPLISNSVLFCSSLESTRFLTAIMGVQYVFSRKARSSDTFILVALCFALFTVRSVVRDEVSRSYRLTSEIYDRILLFMAL
jgi:hypothetical protein